MPDIRIITTSDGSHSLLHAELNETYHSVHGAVRESEHVFIQHGLHYWLERTSKTEIKILEIGFGTGLNAFLTRLYAEGHKVKVYYESWEKFPLESSIVQQLNYPSQLGSGEKFEALHAAAWDEQVVIGMNFSLRKCRHDLLNDGFTEKQFDLVYYDAFAPSKQPEMWTMEVLKKVTEAMSSTGIFVTYCAKGQLKRDLASLGLKVETLAGPPGKKEMVRGIKES